MVPCNSGSLRSEFKKTNKSWKACFLIQSFPNRTCVDLNFSEQNCLGPDISWSGIFRNSHVLNGKCSKLFWSGFVWTQTFLNGIVWDPIFSDQELLGPYMFWTGMFGTRHFLIKNFRKSKLYLYLSSPDLSDRTDLRSETGPGPDRTGPDRFWATKRSAYKFISLQAYKLTSLQAYKLISL